MHALCPKCFPEFKEISSRFSMHNDVPKDDRPLFAQGAIYTTPPPTPLRYGRGYSPQAMYSPGFSPNFQQDYHRSPDCSPRFSTPNHYYNQRAPKLAREDRRGSPRSSWHANDSCVSGSSRFSSLSVHSPHSQKRVGEIYTSILSTLRCVVPEHAPYKKLAWSQHIYFRSCCSRNLHRYTSRIPS